MLRKLTLIGFVVAFTAVGVLAAVVDQPGQVHLIRPQDLPPPSATPSANNPPNVVTPPAGAAVQAPPGFHVDLFYDGTLGSGGSPRRMALAPNGDVFVAESGSSRIDVLRDADGDGKAEDRFTFAGASQRLNEPFGLAFYEGFLYVGNTNGVVRFAYQPGQTQAAGPAEVVIPGLPTGGHSTRDLAFSPDGRKLFVGVGSAGNVDEEGDQRAVIREYNPDGTGYRPFATGLRNPNGLVFNPVTHELWAVVNERDGLGDDLVPDYFTSVKDGGFYGWPYSYIGANLDPRMGGKGQDLAARAIIPDVLIQAHSAPLGAVFYTGALFPQRLRERRVRRPARLLEPVAAHRLQGGAGPLPEWEAGRRL